MGNSMPMTTKNFYKVKLRGRIKTEEKSARQFNDNKDNIWIYVGGKKYGAPNNRSECRYLWQYLLLLIRENSEEGTTKFRQRMRIFRFGLKAEHLMLPALILSAVTGNITCTYHIAKRFKKPFDLEFGDNIILLNCFALGKEYKPLYRILLRFFGSDPRYYHIIFLNAALGGSLEVLEMVYNEGIHDWKILCRYRILQRCIANGFIYVSSWLLKRGALSDEPVDIIIPDLDHSMFFKVWPRFEDLPKSTSTICVGTEEMTLEITRTCSSDGHNDWIPRHFPPMFVHKWGVMNGSLHSSATVSMSLRYNSGAFSEYVDYLLKRVPNDHEKLRGRIIRGFPERVILRIESFHRSICREFRPPMWTKELKYFEDAYREAKDPLLNFTHGSYQYQRPFSDCDRWKTPKTQALYIPQTTPINRHGRSTAITSINRPPGNGLPLGRDLMKEFSAELNDNQDGKHLARIRHHLQPEEYDSILETLAKCESKLRTALWRRQGDEKRHAKEEQERLERIRIEKLKGEEEERKHNERIAEARALEYRRRKGEKEWREHEEKKAREAEWERDRLRMGLHYY